MREGRELTAARAGAVQTLPIHETFRDYVFMDNTFMNIFSFYIYMIGF